jgi:hypothetical protein
MEIEFAADQVDHAEEILVCPVPSRSCFGCLYEAVDALKRTIADSGGEPPHNA